MRNQVQIKILTYETTLILNYVHVYFVQMPPWSKDIAPNSASQDVGRIGKLLHTKTGLRRISWMTAENDVCCDPRSQVFTQDSISSDIQIDRQSESANVKCWS